jgi:hypothetical protein
MIKAGLPLDRVQQLAGVEAGVSPEEIERILGNNDTITNNADAQLKIDDNEKEMDVKYAKFARMQQARIPLAAIQNSARIQGMDVDELNKVLGVTQDFDAKKASRRAVDEEEVMRDVVRILNDELEMVEDGAAARVDSRDDTADSKETTTDEPEMSMKHLYQTASIFPSHWVEIIHSQT